MIFKHLAMAAILFFKMRQVFIAVNIPCKFGEDIFINEWDIKVYAKMWRTLNMWYGGHFVFLTSAKITIRLAFVTI